MVCPDRKAQPAHKGRKACREKMASMESTARTVQPAEKGPQGEKGERGDVLYVGPDEMAAAVKAARQELINQRAQFLAAIDQALFDAGHLHENHRRRTQDMIAKMRRNAGLD